MDAGQLDQRIAIETQTTVRNSFGEDVPTWATASQPWAKVTETPGREFLSGDYQAESKAVFRIRWRAVDSTARVQWRGRAYPVAPSQN